MKNIYIGNIPFKASEEDIHELFGQYGSVNSVKLITDRETGKKRGFGFIEMEDDGAEKAIEALEGKEFMGRTLKVNLAKPRPPRM